MKKKRNTQKKEKIIEFKKTIEILKKLGIQFS